MILTQEKRTVSSGGLGDTRKFTIKVTSKAFDTLVNSLYSNKVAAVVRELCTNAYDAHVEHGNADIPFDVTLPSALNPVFTVRDYGVSMDHDTVMVRYSTLFDSTKDESNESTGMFGIGSKSPFAYTTTFGVRAFLKGEARTYLIALDADSIPQISHVETLPSNEPQGFEINVNVRLGDYEAFYREFKQVLFGYYGRTLPRVLGREVTLPDVILSGKDWTIYDYNGSDFIRQGCIVYPAGHHSISSGRTTIVYDVPIGSVNVASNREQLAWDPTTERFIEGLGQRITTDIEQAAQALFDAQSNTPYQRAHIAKSFVNVLPGIGTNDTLIDIKDFALKLSYPLSGDRKAALTHIEVDDTKWQIVWGLGEKIPRKYGRLRDFTIQSRSGARRYGRTRTLVTPDGFTQNDIHEFCALTGVPDTNFIHVSTLADPGPNSTGYGTAHKRAPRKRVTKFPAGASYIVKERGKLHGRDPSCVSAIVFDIAGFSPSTIVELTTSEVEKLDLNHERDHWTAHVRAGLAPHAGTIQTDICNITARSLIRNDAITPYAAAKIIEDRQISTPTWDFTNARTDLRDFLGHSFFDKASRDAQALRDEALRVYPSLHRGYCPSDSDVDNIIAITKGNS